MAGIPAFAADLAAGGDDYPSEVFPRLAAVEERSFWFLARNRIVVGLFRRFVGTEPARVLEVGCGTGFVLKALAVAFPRHSLVGAEAFVSGLAFAKERVPRAEFCQLDATKMPFEGMFDAVGFFDVLEHLDDDAGAMAGGCRALRNGGWLFVTVPQHAWMWSRLDDASGHKRRYSRSELVRRVEAAGFRVEMVSSFVTTLFPAMVLSRRKGSGDADDAMDSALDDLAPGGAVGVIARVAMGIDEFVIRWGMSLPFGGSLVLVARKR